MTDRHFDESLKNLIDSHKENVADANWELMNARLEQDEMSQLDAQNEAIISDKLNNHKEVFQNNDWVVFNEKMESSIYITNKVFYTKICEALCVFLLFVFLLEYDTYKNAPEDIVLTKRSASLKEQLSSEQHIFSLELLKQSKQWELDLKKSLVRARVTGFTRKQDIQPLEILNVRTIGKSLDIPYRAQIELKTPIAFQHIDQINVDIPIKELLATPIILTKNERNKSYFEFGVSSDINLINTPIDFVFFKNASQTGALGFSAFVGTSSKSSNGNEWSWAAKYSFKSYNPGIIEELRDNNDNTVRRSFSKAEYHLVSLPLQFRKHFDFRDQMSVYFSTGLSFNFVGVTDFDIKSQTKRPSGFPPPTNVSYSKLAQKDFQKGLFQKGDLLKNTYLTSLIGIGFEKRMAADWRMFVQSNFEYHMLSQKIGPNDDQFNVFSLQIGAKMRFK